MEWFDGWPPILWPGLVGLVCYVVVVALLRLGGNRTLAQMDEFDLVVTIANWLARWHRHAERGRSNRRGRRRHCAPRRVAGCRDVDHEPDTTRAPLKAIGIAAAALTLAAAATVDADPKTLHALYSNSVERLRDSPFGRPMWIASTEGDGRLEGEIRALVDHPFTDVEALADPAHWCELLTLLPNIRQCRAAADDRQLLLWFARRFDQPLADTHAVRFDMRIRAVRGAHLEVVLQAPKGPMGTSDYRVELGAVPVDQDRVFVHVRYGYAYGLSARLAAEAYLARRGRDKVGFTVVASDDGGAPVYIGGLRGAVERNAMRLYLAIDAYVDALDESVAQRRDRSLRIWLDAIARYPRQLAEADRSAYLEAKRERL
jgi:hypothetical protein